MPSLVPKSFAALLILTVRAAAVWIAVCVLWPAAASAQLCCSDEVIGAACDGTTQNCDRPITRYASSSGMLTLECVMSTFHCSDVSVTFSVDGIPVYTSLFLGPGESTGVVDLSPVDPGLHEITIDATGTEGGCNAGTLEGWGGELFICADGDANIGIADQPTGYSLCAPVQAQLTVMASGFSPFGYQWRHDGVPLSDEHGHISGAGSDTLQLFNTTSADSGEYDCVVTNACGSAMSDPATLVVCACLECPADFNLDGGVDGSDVSDFFASWENGDCNADVNADGGVDGADVDTFFAAWEAGGC